MSKIIKHMNETVIRKTAARCRERGIVIPAFAKVRDPERIPAGIRTKLPGLGIGNVHPLSLFRISWKNDVGLALYGAVTDIEAQIVGLVGKHFPTGCHKVGAAWDHAAVIAGQTASTAAHRSQRFPALMIFP